MRVHVRWHTTEIRDYEAVLDLPDHVTDVDDYLDYGGNSDELIAAEEADAQTGTGWLGGFTRELDYVGPAPTEEPTDA